MTDTKKTPRPMSFALIFIGLLFFANPYFATLDILPDWIGCALICLGLWLTYGTARKQKGMSTAGLIIKEKTLAAYRAGVKTVLIPEDNMRDLDDIDAEARESLTFIPCKTASPSVRPRPKP